MFLPQAPHTAPRLRGRVIQSFFILTATRTAPTLTVSAMKEASRRHVAIHVADLVPPVRIAGWVTWLHFKRRDHDETEG